MVASSSVCIYISNSSFNIASIKEENITKPPLTKRQKDTAKIQRYFGCSRSLSTLSYPHTMFVEVLYLIAMIIAVVAEEMHITFVNDNPDEVCFSTLFLISFLLNVISNVLIILYKYRQLNSSGKMRKVDDVYLKEQYYRVVDQLQ